MRYTKHIILITLIALLVILAGCKQNTAEKTAFAKCLTENGAKMYGASWCPHCKEQKKEFGDAWRSVNYIECALPGGGQTEICDQAGVEKYPTWEFADGERVTGKLTFEELEERTGCQLA